MLVLDVRWGGAGADGGLPVARTRAAASAAAAQDAPLLSPGGVTTKVITLSGVSRGDVLSAAITSLDVVEHTVQLTAIAGENVAKVVLQNLDERSLDLAPGLLRVVVVKIV